MMTLGVALEEHRGRAPGADTLRFVLATAVLVYHSFWFTLGHFPNETVAVVGKTILVPAFMALSGFLLAASAIRSDTRTFAINRALRIFPGLIVSILLSVFVLGPLIGSLSMSEYFSSPSVWRYLVGAVGWPSYTLPGVFSQNPIPEVVNGSLWSIPVELECYVALGVLLALGLVRYRVVMLAVAVMTLALTAIPFAMEGTRGLHYHVSLFIGQFVYFVTGSVLYLYRHQVPRHIFLFWSAVGIAGVLLMSGHFAVVLPIAVAYATVFLASSPLPPPPGLPGGDYSYGIYIYASPVQQAVLLVSPAVWWLNIVLALPLTIACAIASWIFVEKPALEMKSRRRRAAAESGGLAQPPSALRRPPLASEPAE